MIPLSDLAPDSEAPSFQWHIFPLIQLSKRSGCCCGKLIFVSQIVSFPLFSIPSSALQNLSEGTKTEDFPVPVVQQEQLLIQLQISSCSCRVQRFLLSRGVRKCVFQNSIPP